MLAAIVPHASQAWFFKLLGDDEAVAAESERFHALVHSVSFEDGAKPTWTLPGGWEQLPGSGMRFATVHIPQHDPPLSLTVIPLGAPDPHSDAYLRANVDRWRASMGLAPSTPETLATETQRVQTAAGATATIVELQGRAPTGR